MLGVEYLVSYYLAHTSKFVEVGELRTSVLLLACLNLNTGVKYSQTVRKKNEKFMGIIHGMK